MKVATIVGTRHELIKLSQVLIKLDKYTDHILIHTGQNFDYELNEIFFEDIHNSHNAVILSVEGIKEKLLNLDYIKKQVASK